jgi:6-phosphogluconolactonase
MFVYVGTYSTRGSRGIYTYRFDPARGRLEDTGLATASENPSFLAPHPSGRFLYAVDEVTSFAGESGKAEPGGAVSAFSIDPDTGNLTFLNARGSQGAAPCHLCVHPSGRALALANYSGGSVASFPLQSDGTLGESASFFQHEGASVNASRQSEPHAHSVTLDASGRFAFACDLGLDKILAYRIDASSGQLSPHDPPFARLHPGAGPRHFAFHPSGRYGYAINELDSSVSAFTYDAERGALQELHSVSALPEGFEGESWCADIHVHPSGRFLYGSNRGHDSIAIYAIDQGTGRLSLLGHEPTQGRSPRNFAIDPSGDFLLAANQQSDSVVAFRIDPRTGLLEPTGQVVSLPAPVCVRFLPLASA